MRSGDRTAPGDRAQARPDAAREGAEALAIAALGWLAADEERLDRFLALSGLTPQTLRRAAAAPDFLASVLDHILAHEPTLLAFAADEKRDPAEVERDRHRLDRGRPPIVST